MLSEFIQRLSAQEALTTNESYQLAKMMLSGSIDALTTVEILELLSDKGETVAELLGFHQALSQTAPVIDLKAAFVDIVGTGGDKMHSLNLSTGGALLTAACGVPVVKHGNRAASSNCGSADVLAELGFSLNTIPAEIPLLLAQHNFAFLYAPNFYPCLAKLAPMRKQLGKPSIFNLLGPLLNPAGRAHVILGVYKPAYVAIIAETLYQLGTECSLVFYANGLDELSCLGVIEALLVTRTAITPLRIDPLSLGLRPASLADLRGGDKLYNAQMLQRTLNGIDSASSDSIVLNAAVAVYLFGRVTSLAAGVAMAKERLRAGNIVPLNRLQQIIARKYQPPLKRKSMCAALKAQSFAVISEIKRASPSAGNIASIDDPLTRAKYYVSCGAAAISVLTDEGFKGSNSDLRAVAAGLKDTPVPVLCKDFMLTPPQIVTAADCGADVILLIVQVLKDNTIMMAKFAHAYGLEVLIEVHSAAELLIALQAEADIIGVNQRDLTDFSMHPDKFSQLIGLIPADKIKIAESGIKTRAQALATLALGYDGILVGEALSRLAEPAEFFTPAAETPTAENAAVVTELTAEYISSRP